MAIESAIIQLPFERQRRTITVNPSLQLASSATSPMINIEFIVRHKFQWVIRGVNGASTLVHERLSPTLGIRFFLPPRYFFEGDSSQSIIREMLWKVGINGRLRLLSIGGAVQSFAQEMILSESKMGRNELFLLVEIEVLNVMLYDERVALERILRESEENAREGYGVVPASKSSIEALQMVLFEDGNASSEDCRICLEEFEAGSWISRMPCSHVFHRDCLTQWLSQSHYCPLCRFEMPT
uniref:RING-type domain-containing protein n=1 Tax=Nelumbo nucifera TaxID=4432 RepID=A0A822YDY9_NELNU|nr:TPA_asm: hypothetical protein HUJ06_011235 [Nelumbo nucifera]